MRHQHDGRAAAVRVPQQVQHLLARPGIEVPGRLVGEDQRRVDDHRPRDRHPLHLPTRQLVGTMVAAMRDGDGVEGVRDALPHLARRPTVEHQGQRDVLLGRQRRQQVEELEDDADPPATEDGHLVVAQARDRGAVDRHVARRRLIESTHQVEQRAFRAAGTHDGDELPPLDGERHVVQRPDPAAALVEEFGDVPQRDHAEGSGRTRTRTLDLLRVKQAL